MKLRTLSILLFSSALAACNMTQPPAEVVMKGTNMYGTRNAPTPTRVASMTPEQEAMAAPVAHRPVGSGSAAPASAATYASANTNSSYAAASNISSRPQATSAKVMVKDLAPLTPAKAESAPALEMAPAPAPAAAPEEEVTTAAAPQTLQAPEKQKYASEAEAELARAVKEEAEMQAGVLPEPQARATVAENKTIAEETPATVSSKGFIWPVKGKVISEFGSKVGGEYNDGINIAAQQGEPIVAAADGEVVYSGNELRGYGNMIIVRHDNGLMTAYAHADRILVSKGEQVKQGVTIATVGKSGGVDQTQVHFGVRKDKQPIDPIKVLDGANLALKN